MGYVLTPRVSMTGFWEIVCFFKKSRRAGPWIFKKVSFDA
jgi:hypothetical protein